MQVYFAPSFYQQGWLILNPLPEQEIIPSKHSENIKLFKTRLMKTEIMNIFNLKLLTLRAGILF